MLYVWIKLCSVEYRGCATPGGWVTPKKLVFLGVLGLADCTPDREPRSVADSFSYFYKTFSLAVWGWVAVVITRRIALQEVARSNPISDGQWWNL